MVVTIGSTARTLSILAILQRGRSTAAAEAISCFDQASRIVCTGLRCGGSFFASVGSFFRAEKKGGGLLSLARKRNQGTRKRNLAKSTQGRFVHQGQPTESLRLAGAAHRRGRHNDTRYKSPKIAVFPRGRRAVSMVSGVCEDKSCLLIAVFSDHSSAPFSQNSLRQCAGV